MRYAITSILGVLCALLPIHSVAQKDTIPSFSKSWQSTALTVAPFFVLGAASYNQSVIFYDLRNRYTPNTRYFYDDYLQYFPAALMLGLKVSGVEGRSSWGRMLASDAFTIILQSGLINGIKYSVKRLRPDGTAYNSFPSGHTATAFMTATMLHREYGVTISPWYSIGGYAVATAVGVSRIINNKHWISDVLVGAGIGIVSTELGYYVADLIFKDKGLRRSHANFVSSDLGERPSFVGLSMGVSLLPKLSAPADIKLATAMGATTGIEGAWFFHRYVGIGGKLTFTNAPLLFDEENYASKALALSVPIQKVEVTSLALRNAFVGPYISLPLTSRLNLSAKATLGYNIGDTYGVKLILENGTKRELFSSTFIGNMAVNTGIAATYILNRNLGIRAFADFTSASTDISHRLDVSPDLPTPQFNYSSTRSNIGFYTFGITLSAIIWE